MLIYTPKTLTCTRSTLPVIYTWNNKAWMTAHPFAMWVTENVKLTLGNYSEKKNSFQKYYCSLTIHLVTQEQYMRIYDLSFQTRDQACIPCIARLILNHWTTMEVPILFLTSELLFVCLLSSISFETKESGTHFSCSYIPIFTHIIFSVFTQELRWRCTMGLTLFSCLLA